MSTAIQPMKADTGGGDSAQELARRLRKLRERKQFEEAETVGKEAVRRYPGHAALLSEHSETAIRRKTWGAAIERLEALLALPGAAVPETALRLAKVYVGLGQAAEAEVVLDRASREVPGDLRLRRGRVMLELLDPARRHGREKWDELASFVLKAAINTDGRMDAITACVAGLRFSGATKDARDLLENHYQARDTVWGAALKDGYSRLVIFDNGRTRIEYLQKLFDPATDEIVTPDQLAITFDLMEQTWDKEPFAYRPLSPQVTDFLSVRKRSKDDFHQDLRRADFLEIAGPIAARYREVVSLGQSLGAYSGLYYASWLPGCRVLATAPRNPQHPRYGGKRHANHKLFLHEYEMPLNPTGRPTIVYDPKNEEDARYVEQSLLARFPHAVVLRYPYCGHSLTRYLRDTGALKSATLGFFDGLPFPAFDKRVRGKSAEYLRNLAKLNLRKGRFGRARRLAEKALELGADVERTREFLSKIEVAALPSTNPSGND